MRESQVVQRIPAAIALFNEVIEARGPRMIALSPEEKLLAAKPTAMPITLQ
jgi:hypothetical protein